MGREENGKVTLIGPSLPGGQSALDVFGAVSKLSHVERIIGYPDRHLGGQEWPIGGAVVTKGSVVPAFSSEEINCGMSLIELDLRAENVNEDFYEEFLLKLHAERYGSWNSLSGSEFERVCRYGASAILEKFGLQEDLLDKFEYRGCLFEAGELQDLNLSDLIPRLLWYSTFRKQLAQAKFTGNHFLEFQTVSEVLCPESMESLGLHSGKLLICYHFGSAFSWYLMRSFPWRRSMERVGRLRRLAYFLMKVHLHLARGCGFSGTLKERWKLYFRSGLYQGFDPEAREGRRMIAAIKIATNVGFAARLAMFGIIRKVIRDMKGASCGVRMFRDVPHDTILEEHLNGESRWVARKGLAIVRPRKLAIVSGNYDVPSIVGMGLRAKSNTVPQASHDHGMSQLIKHYGKKTSLESADNSVICFRIPWGDPTWRHRKREKTPLMTSRALDFLKASLTGDQRVKPCALVRPVANLKDVE